MWSWGVQRPNNDVAELCAGSAVLGYYRKRTAKNAGNAVLKSRVYDEQLEMVALNYDIKGQIWK